jgi:hypothetical protein
MLILRFALSLALFSGRPAIIMAQRVARPEHGFLTGRSKALVVRRLAAGGMCAMAAESVRGWGWGSEESNIRPTPIGSAVSAVNYQLRINSGQLGPEDLARLKLARLSSDRCLRELATSVLYTQKDNARNKQSVTRSLEKQSLTREALSP